MKSPLRAQLFGYVGTKMPKIWACFMNNSFEMASL
jgi:hypothetical protein